MSIELNDEQARRYREQYQRAGSRFERTDFLGALTGHRFLAKNGLMEISFHVGPGEKDRAWELSECIGELLLITVERISLKDRRRARREAQA